MNLDERIFNSIHEQLNSLLETKEQTKEAGLIDENLLNQVLELAEDHLRKKAFVPAGGGGGGPGMGGPGMGGGMGMDPLAMLGMGGGMGSPGMGGGMGMDPLAMLGMGGGVGGPGMGGGMGGPGMGGPGMDMGMGGMPSEPPPPVSPEQVSEAATQSTGTGAGAGGASGKTLSDVSVDEFKSIMSDAVEKGVSGLAQIITRELGDVVDKLSALVDRLSQGSQP